jgi:hypothetical protein
MLMVRREGWLPTVIPAHIVSAQAAKDVATEETKRRRHAGRGEVLGAAAMLKRVLHSALSRRPLVARNFDPVAIRESRDPVLRPHLVSKTGADKRAG